VESEAHLDKFRKDFRNWLEDNAPQGWRQACTRQEAFVDTQRDWYKKLVAAGYATPHWAAAGRWPSRRSSTRRSPAPTRRG
jgi:hypothetical protein